MAFVLFVLLFLCSPLLVWWRALYFLFRFFFISSLFPRQASRHRNSYSRRASIAEGLLCFLPFAVDVRFWGHGCGWICILDILSFTFLAFCSRVCPLLPACLRSLLLLHSVGLSSELGCSHESILPALSPFVLDHLCPLAVFPTFLAKLFLYFFAIRWQYLCRSIFDWMFDFPIFFFLPLEYL